MKNKLSTLFLLAFLPCLLLCTGCNKQLLEELKAAAIAPLPGQELTVDTDTLAIYVPNEFADMNLYNNASTWSYERSQESTHFIVLWGAGYGANHPNAAAVPETYRVDIDDLLAKAEQFYAININTLKFAERGVGRSNLDNYKMMIFLHYTTEWMAYGGGYDDTIGALWINPATCKPVGSTIAHEIGHSFQYQVFADLKGGSGFRYGFGGNGGNAFWEQTAQWQAHQTYPAEAFTTYNFTVYTENYHRHIHHEWQRYASYFIHNYWADKHGIDIIGRIWREANQPEDPIQAYMRITGINVSQLNAELYEAATHFVTWDLPSIRTQGENYIGMHTNKFSLQANGSYRVSYDRCPGTTGYNVIPLQLPAAGTQITAAFKGLPNAPGFNAVDAVRAGWRYGYVALLNNGTRVYGDMAQGTEQSVNFTVPANCSKLWFVVTGAPSTYQAHAWDEIETNDDQWPYEVKFTNSGILGFIDVGAEPQNVTLTQSISFPYDSQNYTGATITLNATQLATAFAIQPSELASLMTAQEIKFYAIEQNGTLNPTTTANGYGHWFAANGNITTWGSNSVLFAEFDANTYNVSIGQFPGAATAGTEYTIRQALVYTYDTNKTAQATLIYKVKVE